MLYYSGGGKLSIKSWGVDKRMGKNSTCDRSLSKFDCVINDGEFYKATDACVEVIDQWFGAETLKDILIKGDTLKKHDNNIKFHGYRISKIPYEIYLYKNPEMREAFDKIYDRFAAHYNSQECNTRLINKLVRSKGIKERSLIAFHSAFPNFPDTITVYRGIKGEYNDERNKTGYSCWTYDKEEAIRFAKHIFTGGMQFEPMYSENPHLLEVDVRIEDITVFIGRYEKEVILKNPISIKYITKL
jgi:hypothetical protein